MSDKSLNEQLEANKKLVKDFLEDIIFNFNYQNIDKYIGEPYIQHNPQVDDGKEALRAMIKKLSDQYKVDGKLLGPNHKWKFQRFIAEGDLVVAHYYHGMWPNEETGGALVDILRVKDGKLVEHWDVIQPLPEESENDHPMF